MILVVDVGNTNITFGVYKGQNLQATFHITTKTIIELLFVFVNNSFLFCLNDKSRYINIFVKNILT